MADVVGYIALAIMVVALIRKDSRHLLLMISVGVLLWAVHYALLGAMPGAVTHAIAAVGVFLAHAQRDASYRARMLCALIFSALGVAGSLYYGITAANSVAAIGCVVMTTSQYLLRGVRMRQGFLAGEALFFIFALLVGSVPGMMVTTANGAAGLVGLFRIRNATKTNKTMRGSAHATESLGTP